MTSLDCADPSMRVDKRNESLSALQALALLNNGFMVTHGAALRRAGAAAKRRTSPAQVDRAFRLALGRAPSAGGARAARRLRASNGLANACRVILNLNEFVFVD